ncbi:MAG: cytochrome C oxidase subunit IV family protein [Planctomycetota bacterium]|nr:cytochrome C oxidase subunit IV family protein [Planctomycetota bacterium]
MSHSTDVTGGHGDAEHEQHGSIGTYLAVFVALCILTGASFFTYSSYWPFSDHVAWAFMMAISCTKAMLVILFFMHLKYEANWKYVLTVPATFMSLFLVLMLVPDVGLRMRRASEERLRYMAVPQVTDAPADQHSSEQPDGH